MKNNVTTVFLVSGNINDVEYNAIAQIIKDGYGENVRITRIRSSNVFDKSHGFANLVQQHKHRKNVKVCGNKDILTAFAYKAAENTGIPFLGAHKNAEGNWELLEVNEAKVEPSITA